MFSSVNYSGCSKSHQMISFQSRRQLVIPLFIGKAQAPVQLRTNILGRQTKTATSCLRRLHNQHPVGQSLRLGWELKLDIMKSIPSLAQNFASLTFLLLICRLFEHALIVVIKYTCIFYFDRP